MNIKDIDARRSQWYALSAKLNRESERLGNLIAELSGFYMGDDAEAYIRVINVLKNELKSIAIEMKQHGNNLG